VASGDVAARRMRVWLALLAGAAVLLGCGVFFAVQDLGKAEEYASVASFFLALLTAIGSVLSLIRSRSKERTAGDGEQGKPPGRGTTVNYAWGNDVVQTGEGSYGNVIKIVGQPPGNRVRRNRRPRPPSGRG
jgi:hypothetical protein